jgi:hypothetical protein
MQIGTAIDCSRARQSIFNYIGWAADVVNLGRKLCNEGELSPPLAVGLVVLHTAECANEGQVISKYDKRPAL